MADRWVLETLGYKYKISFSTIPGHFCEQTIEVQININNCYRKMISWEKKGFCIRVDQQSYCTNPMAVASQKDLETGEMKFNVWIFPDILISIFWLNTFGLAT